MVLHLGCQQANLDGPAKCSFAFNYKRSRLSFVESSTQCRPVLQNLSENLDRRNRRADCLHSVDMPEKSTACDRRSLLLWGGLLTLWPVALGVHLS